MKLTPFAFIIFFYSNIATYLLEEKNVEPKTQAPNWSRD